MKLHVKAVRFNSAGERKFLSYNHNHLFEVIEVFKDGTELWMADFRTEKMAKSYVAIIEIAKEIK